MFTLAGQPRVKVVGKCWGLGLFGFGFEEEGPRLSLTRLLLQVLQDSYRSLNDWYITLFLRDLGIHTILKTPIVLSFRA